MDNIVHVIVCVHLCNGLQPQATHSSEVASEHVHLCRYNHCTPIHKLQNAVPAMTYCICAWKRITLDRNAFASGIIMYSLWLPL